MSACCEPDYCDSFLLAVRSSELNRDIVGLVVNDEPELSCLRKSAVLEAELVVAVLRSAVLKAL